MDENTNTIAVENPPEEIPSIGSPESVTSDELVRPLVKAMPDMPEDETKNGSKIPEENEIAEHLPDEKFGITDASGEMFDPSIHKSDSNGNPVYKPDGTFRRNKRGRPSSQSGEEKSYSKKPPTISGNKSDQYDYLADVYMKSGIGLAVATFGNDMLPDDKPEEENLRQSIAAYLRYKQVDDIDPFWAMVGTVSGYALKRMPRPTVKERVKMYWDFITSKLKILKRKDKKDDN